VKSLTLYKVDLPLENVPDPQADVWARAVEVVVPLSATPLEAQTSAYVRSVWRGRPYGLTPYVAVRAFHGDGWVAFRLSWPCPAKSDRLTDDDAFLDAACLLFASSNDTPIAMGSAERPVEGWLWRADWPRPRLVRAQGPGTSLREEVASLRASAVWERGHWIVSLAGPRRAEGFIAIAIWQGAHQERAGIKAYSPSWLSLSWEGGSE